MPKVYRYYVSFCFNDSNGLAFGNSDIDMPLITGRDDVQALINYLTRTVGHDVMNVAFSLYADPTPAPTGRASHPARHS